MIEPINMFEDLRSDKVGLDIMALRSMPIWNKEKHAGKERLLATATDFGYLKGWGRSSTYHLTYGMGFSYIYRVPSNKRGQLTSVRDKLIRLIYLYGDKRLGTAFMFGEVSDDQCGRNYCSMTPNPSSKDFDVRRLYQFAYGEHSFNGSTEKHK